MNTTTDGTVNPDVNADVAIRPRRRVPVWGVLVVLATAVSMWGRWSSDVFPANQAANHLLFGEYILRERTWVHHGPFSVIELGYPGPVLFLFAATGLLLGRILPLITPDAGVMLVYTLAYWSFVAFNAKILARVTRTPATAPVVVLVHLWLLRPRGYHWTPPAPTTLYVSAFAALVASSAAVAFVALAGRYRWAPALCVLMGGLSVQASLATAPLGALVALAGVVMSLPALGSWGRGEHPVRRVRLGSWFALCAAVGLGPLVARVVFEDPALPFTYLQQLAQRSASAAPAPVAAQPQGELTRFAEAWGVSSIQALLLAIAIAAVLLAGLGLRRTRTLAALAAVPVALTALVTLTAAEFHPGQSMPALLLPVLTIAPALGLFAGRIPRRLKPAGTLTALCVAGMALWVSTYSVKVDKPGVFLWERTEITELAGNLTDRFPEGSRVVIISSNGDSYPQWDGDYAPLWSAMLALYRDGEMPCVKGWPKAEVPERFTKCSIREAAQFLVVEPDPEARSPNAATLVGRIDGVRFYAGHPSMFGLVACPRADEWRPPLSSTHSTGPRC